MTLARQAIAGTAGTLLACATLTGSQVQAAQVNNSEGLEIEEIVVTATKREVKLQEVPQAITAITAAQLEELNAQTFDDYFRSVPGLGVITPGLGKRDYSLRGVSSGQISTSNNIDISTVSQYFDEIPVTASGFQMDPRLVDVDRIEVLRGPQGTYYGEGALGGMIRIITRKPVLGRFSANVEGRFSSTQDGDTSNSASGMVNLPFASGNAAVRLNAFHAEDGGYIDAVDLDDAGRITRTHRQDINSATSSGFRGVLLAEAADWLSVQAQAVHFESEEIFSPFLPEVGDLLYGIAPCRPPPPPDPNAPPPDPNMPPPDVQCDGGRFGSIDRSGDLYNLTLSADFGWASLVSATSFADSEVGLGQEVEYTDRPGTSSDMMTQGVQGFTQEVRLVSSRDWSTQWDFVIGAYYQDKETRYDYVGELAHVQELDATESALFADAGYAFADQWQVRLGLRGSHVSNEGAITIPPDFFNPNGRQIDTDGTFNPVTGRVVLTYQITPDRMTYTSVARGFRNGTLNDTTLNFNPFVSSIPGYTPIPDHSEPDTNTTYEFGWKLSFPRANAVLNGAVYRSDWEDMQVVSFASSSNPDGPNVFPGALPAYVNAPRARIDGFELEASVEPWKGLQLRGSLSLIDAVLTEDFPLNLQDLGGDLHARKGDRIPFVARRSGSLSASYRAPVFGTFDGFVIVNGQYQGPRTTDFNAVLNSTPADGGTSQVPITTYFELDSYWTTGLQVGLQNAQWRAAAYVDNALNERADLFHTIGRVTNRPRTIGLVVRYNFN